MDLDLMELLRRMQAPAVDTETGFYDPYQSYYSPVRSLGNVGPRPKIKSVVTETEGQPRKVTTTFDFPDTPRKFIPGDTGVYGPSSMSASFPAVASKPFSFGAIRDFGIGPNPHLDPSMDQMFTANTKFLIDKGLFDGAIPGGGIAGIFGIGRRAAAARAAADRASKPKVTPEQAAQAAAERARLKNIGGLGEQTLLTTPAGIAALAATTLIPSAPENTDLPDPLRVEAYEPPVEPVVGNSVVLSDKGRIFADSPGDEGYIPDYGSFFNEDYYSQGQVGRSPYYTERAGERLAFLKSQNAPQITQVRSDAVQVEENPILKSMYGRFARDPESRKQQYLDQLNKIYRNAMILNAIANLTGGQSQAGAYLKMATAKMDAIDKFDQEKRLQDIWKAIYFDQDGEYRAPGSWDKAFEMAIVLGASPEEASEIASIAYDKPDRDKDKNKKTDIQKKIEYYKSIGFTEEEALAAAKYDAGIAARPSDTTSSKTALEKKIEFALSVNAITPEEAQIAIRYDALGGKPGSDKAFAARGHMLKIYLNTYSGYGNKLMQGAPPFHEWFARPENQQQYYALLHGLVSTETGSGDGMVTNVQRIVEN